MTWTRDYRSGHVEWAGIDTTGTPVPVRGITRLQIVGQSEIQKEITSGSQYPSVAILNAVRPLASITTLDIASAFTNLSTMGKCITSDVDDPGFVMYGQQQTCAGVATGASHDRYIIPEGVLVPTTLTANHRANVEISYDAYSKTPDPVITVPDPVVREIDESLPSQLSFNRFELNKMTIGDVSTGALDADGKRSLTINWNPDITQEGADSTQFDTVVSISSIQPTITLRGVDTDWLALLVTDTTRIAPLTGRQAIRASSVIWLKDRLKVATDPAHIKIEFDGLVSWNTLFDAGPEAPGEAEIQIDTYSVDGGATDPLTVTTGQVIT